MPRPNTSELAKRLRQNNNLCEWKHEWLGTPLSMAAEKLDELAAIEDTLADWANLRDGYEVSMEVSERGGFSAAPSVWVKLIKGRNSLSAEGRTFFEALQTVLRHARKELISSVEKAEL